MEIDTSTEFGQRVAQRLQEEQIIWLTTIESKGIPQTRPVWFIWDGTTFLIYSEAAAFKIGHIATNSQVSLNFDSDGLGGDIIVFIGEAWLDEDAPPANQVSTYVEKYREGMAGIDMTPEQFAESFAAALRIKPTKLRGIGDLLA